MPAPTVLTPPRHYLNNGYGVASWLLTRDHKRIALLYLASVTFFFFVGGAFAVLIRLDLATPAGDLVSDETYNKLFTMHGVMMVFFFLIPAIPSVLGNFLVPIMIGAKDLAFPKLNLASWYIYIIGATFTTYSLVTGGLVGGLALSAGLAGLALAVLLLSRLRLLALGVLPFSGCLLLALRALLPGLLPLLKRILEGLNLLAGHVLQLLAFDLLLKTVELLSGPIE